MKSAVQWFGASVVGIVSMGVFLSQNDSPTEGRPAVVTQSPVNRNAAPQQARHADSGPSPFARCGPTHAVELLIPCVAAENSAESGSDTTAELPLRTRIAPLLTRIENGDLPLIGNAGVALRNCIVQSHFPKEAGAPPPPCTAEEAADLLVELHQAAMAGTSKDKSPAGVRAHAQWILECQELHAKLRRETWRQREESFLVATRAALAVVESRIGQYPDPDLVEMANSLRRVIADTTANIAS